MGSSSLDSAIAQACKKVPKLHISDDAQPEAKIRKLVAGVHEAKAKFGRVPFYFNMKIA